MTPRSFYDSDGPKTDMEPQATPLTNTPPPTRRQLSIQAFASIAIQHRIYCSKGKESHYQQPHAAKPTMSHVPCARVPAFNPTFRHHQNEAELFSCLHSKTILLQYIHTVQGAKKSLACILSWHRQGGRLLFLPQLTRNSFMFSSDFFLQATMNNAILIFFPIMSHVLCWFCCLYVILLVHCRTCK